MKRSLWPDSGGDKKTFVEAEVHKNVVAWTEVAVTKWREGRFDSCLSGAHVGLGDWMWGERCHQVSIRDLLTQCLGQLSLGARPSTALAK